MYYLLALEVDLLEFHNGADISPPWLVCFVLKDRCKERCRERFNVGCINLRLCGVTTYLKLKMLETTAWPITNVNHVFLTFTFIDHQITNNCKSRILTNNFILCMSRSSFIYCLGYGYLTTFHCIFIDIHINLKINDKR